VMVSEESTYIKEIISPLIISYKLGIKSRLTLIKPESGQFTRAAAWGTG
jgi:hypothetical protein